MRRLLQLAAILAALLAFPAIEARAQARLMGVDHNGQSVTAQAPSGWRLVMFGYAHCPDVCPLGLQTLTETMDRLGPLAERFTPIFVTVDPARDTPAAMKDYVSMFHPKLVGITPTPAELDAMAAEWRVKYVKGPVREGGDYAVDHTANIHLVDPAGRILRRLPHDQPGEVLADRIRAALLSQ